MQKNGLWIKHVDNPVKSDTLNPGGLLKILGFHQDKDWLYDVYGSALKNNKTDVDRIINYVYNKGGGVRVVNNGDMYYNPGCVGYPGEIVIDENASIGAWRHEFRHFLDDEADGFPGLSVIADVDKYWEREYTAYMEEFELAKEIDRNDILVEIEKQMDDRKREIYGE